MGKRWLDPAAGNLTLAGVGTFFTVDTEDLGRFMTLQIVANVSANTIVWECSNDNNTWVGFALVATTNVITAPSAGGTSSGAGATFTGGIPGRYVRARMSNFVGGVTTVRTLFSDTPISPLSIGVDTELPSAAALADATANPTLPSVGAFPFIWTGGVWNRLTSFSGNGDGTAGGAALAAGLFNWNGASLDRVRTPNVFKTIPATALGNTALWTPGAGKKFRLMKFMLMVSGDSSMAAAAVNSISLIDSATSIGLTFPVFIPAASPNINGILFQTPWIDLGNGILSAAANNVLNINLATALATGQVRVIAIGTEE